MQLRIHHALLLLVVASTAGSAVAINVDGILPGPLAKYETVITSSKLRKTCSRFGSAAKPSHVAVAFIRNKLKVPDCQYKITREYSSPATGATHVILKQHVNGIPVVNGDAAVHVDKSGKVVAYTDGFHRITDPTKQKLWNGQHSCAFVRPRDAFVAFAKHIKKPMKASCITEVSGQRPEGNSPQYVLKGIPYAKKGVIAQQAYVHTQNGTLEAAWELFADFGDNYFNALVSANGKQMLALSDWVAAATYNALKFGDNDLGTANRTMITDPELKDASPKGWQDFNGTQSDTTTGNNVMAVEAADPKRGLNSTVPVATNSTFDFPVDLNQDPNTYIDAAVTNLYVACNYMHDLTHAYGFTEAAGNFQNDNYGRGGKGGDSVLARAHDPSSTNNARFLTPPDGQQPHMHMYLWDETTPRRDGSFDNGIIFHEYTHGVSNRLTGGPDNVNCLTRIESSGMGEGWSDFVAIWTRLKAEDKRDKNMLIGEYVNGGSTRRYPYSTDMKENPTNYGMVYTLEWFGAHNIGEIWGNVLYEMYWNLVDKLGFSEDKMTPDVTKGNTLALQLVIEAMKLQPCNPSFPDARNAILLAELMLTGGKHQCELWKAFAKRGVGYNAASKGFFSVVADYTVPEFCNRA